MCIRRFHLLACSGTTAHAGRVSHPHPPLINREVITAAQLFIEHTSCESHPFLTLLKLALKSYFQQAFHLVQLCQHDLRTMSCDFGELASAPRIKTQSSSRFSCFCVSEWLPPRSHGGKKSLRHTNQQTSGPMNYSKILEIIYTDKNLCHHVLLKIRQLLSMFLLLF